MLLIVDLDRQVIIDTETQGMDMLVGPWVQLLNAADSVNSMAWGLAEKERVRDLLGEVDFHQIAEQLLYNPIELGGEERVGTILFYKIHGFTRFCEGLPPKELLKTSNKVLSITSDIVESRQRGVDKYNGDAVMALFGVRSMEIKIL